MSKNIEDVSVEFEDSYLNIDEGDSYRIMYLHKGFAFVIMDEVEDGVSFIPLTDSHIDSLLNSVGCTYHPITSYYTKELLNRRIHGLDRQHELSRINF